MVSALYSDYGMDFPGHRLYFPNSARSRGGGGEVLSHLTSKFTPLLSPWHSYLEVLMGA
jgi:hypothetical protein